MSVASQIQRIKNAVADAYDSVEEKGGTLPASETVANLATAIDSITIGGTFHEPESKDIDFYDYDGTRLYSYTLAEAAALTALPTPPTHDGLTNYGWTESLNTVKTIGHVLDVGAQYKSTDGSTILEVELYSSTPQVVVIGAQSAANATTIDWGDGTTTTCDSTSQKAYSHSYSVSSFPAYKTIKILVSEGNTATIGQSGSSGGPNIFGTSYNAELSARLMSAVIGERTTCGIGCFYNMRRLRTLVIPYGTSSTPSHLCYGCRGLLGIVLPAGVTNVIWNSFSIDYCNQWRQVVLPTTVTTLGNGAFYGITSNRIILNENISTFGDQDFRSVSAVDLMIFSSAQMTSSFAFSCFIKRIVLSSNQTTIPSAMLQSSVLNELKINANITNIAAAAFYSCSCLRVLDFRQNTQVPTLANSNALSGCSATIVVPDSLYDDWIVANNWSGYASKIVKASEYTE